jgi:hypothetical protein
MIHSLHMREHRRFLLRNHLAKCLRFQALRRHSRELA